MICMCFECVESFARHFQCLPTLKILRKVRHNLSCLEYLYQRLIFIMWLLSHTVYLLIFPYFFHISAALYGDFVGSVKIILVNIVKHSYIPKDFHSWVVLPWRHFERLAELYLLMCFVRPICWTLGKHDLGQSGLLDGTHRQCCYLPVKLACIMADGLSLTAGSSVVEALLIKN